VVTPSAVPDPRGLGITGLHGPGRGDLATGRRTRHYHRHHHHRHHHDR